MLHKSLKSRFLKTYCQAQPQPQLNLAEISSNLTISTPPTRESSEISTSSYTSTVNQVWVNHNLNPNLILNLNHNPNLNLNLN